MYIFISIYIYISINIG